MALTAVDVLFLVIDQLEALSIPYALGGSFASSIHGVPRSTNDADIVADIRLAHVDALVQALASAFYVDGDAIEDAIRHRGSFNVIHLGSMFKVDVFLPRRRAFDRSQLSRRIPEVIAHDPDRSAYVASAEDTILAKLEWYRAGGEVSERQWTDILGILKVRAADVERDYLRRWADDLGLADLLERALDDASLG